MLAKICTNVHIFEKYAQNMHKICTKHRRFCFIVLQRLFELSAIEADNYVFQNKICVSVASYFSLRAPFGSTRASQMRLFAKCAYCANCAYCAYFVHILMKCAYFELPNCHGSLYPSSSDAGRRAKEVRGLVKWNRI